jgi:FAD:protein FMN transferase
MRFHKLLLIVILFLVSCSQKAPIYEHKDFIFGTIVDIKIYGETEEKSENISNLIFNDFKRLHNYLHPWEKSLISSMNNAIAAGSVFNVDDEEIIRIIQDNKNLASKSENYFNPAIGKLIALWGFHQELPNQTVPKANQINELLANITTMDDLKINQSTLSSANRNFQLDLGGYAKGYALDRAKKILANNGVANALVNIGGNIIAIGMHGDRSWIVGIQHPRKPSAIASIQLPPGWSIGTSGDYQRYFMDHDKRYSHLINPRTGFPADNSQSATIMIPPANNSGALSDAYSKPLFIAPEIEKLQLADKLGIDFFMVVLANGDILISSKMNESIQWLEQNNEKNITVH